jgi:hypothetical protein
VKIRVLQELLERLILLAVNNLLVAPHNLQALLHDIQALIRAPTHRKDAFEHLQKAVVGTGGRRGTTTAVEEPTREALRSLGIAG